MNPLAELQNRFRAALRAAGQQDSAIVDELVQLVRPSQEPRFGDYQANFAMPLAKRFGRPPREVAAEIVGHLDVQGFCAPPQVEGPGFINLRLQDDWLAEQLRRAVGDERLGVPTVERPRTYVIDFSSPNVAKPMHVGHIRSTVIGDCIVRLLKFLGHRVISDNHIGDWGTQFGMIIYGAKHFMNAEAYRANPVEELGRLYRLVRQLIDYHEGRALLPRLRETVGEQERAVQALSTSTQPPPPSSQKNAERNALKAVRKAESNLREAQNELAELEAKLAGIEADPLLSPLAVEHADIGRAVLSETANLHMGDPENLRLWREFLPPCLVEIERVYKRLRVEFDHTLGESFYHDRLPKVVRELTEQGLARESEGALCVFLEGFAAPMLIRKQDGAYLYSTTDLATIQYRMSQWSPDSILYVVDHRQSLHFEQLFATARRWGYTDVKLAHLSFGTVLGEDGRPFKTRSGDTVGLWGLLEAAVNRAYAVVAAGDQAGEIPQQRRREIAEVVGIGALKYADLAQNRTSDYTFSYERMLAMNGNTATYMQYAYARVLSIFNKGEVGRTRLRSQAASLEIPHPAERGLALALLQFSESLDMAAQDYRPNVLTSYLFDLAGRYSTFFEQCPVLRADSPQQRTSRLLLCDLTARTIRQGLDLLGIRVVDKM